MDRPDSRAGDSVTRHGVEFEERFWSKVDWDLDDVERCWPWTASKMWRGYGQFRFVDVHGKQCVARAHRLAYELEFGPVPEVGEGGIEVHLDHECHDPATCQLGDECPHRACCNPFHMRLTTNHGNHASGRANSAAGGRAAIARRTPEQRIEIVRKSTETRWTQETRGEWSDAMRRQWAERTPEQRAEIGRRISAAKRR